MEGRQPLALQGRIHGHLAVPVTIPSGKSATSPEHGIPWPGGPRGDMARNRTCDLLICDRMLYRCATMPGCCALTNRGCPCVQARRINDTTSLTPRLLMSPAAPGLQCSPPLWRFLTRKMQLRWSHPHQRCRGVGHLGVMSMDHWRTRCCLTIQNRPPCLSGRPVSRRRRRRQHPSGPGQGLAVLQAWMMGGLLSCTRSGPRLQTWKVRTTLPMAPSCFRLCVARTDCSAS